MIVSFVWEQIFVDDSYNETLPEERNICPAHDLFTGMKILKLKFKQMQANCFVLTGEET